MMLFIFWVNRRVISGALELSIFGYSDRKMPFVLNARLGVGEGRSRINRDKYRLEFLLHFIKQNMMLHMNRGIGNHEKETIYR